MVVGKVRYCSNHNGDEMKLDEAFVTQYASEHLPDGEDIADGLDATGSCVGCEHRRRAQESIEPDDGDWCFLVAGIGGEDRWGECPTAKRPESAIERDPF
jgi:hypothetical protein